MLSTIFCSFDHMDLADLALGRLRSEVGGIYEIEHLSEGGRGTSGSPTQNIGGWMGIFPGSLIGFQGMAGGAPPRPVSVKIVCDESVKQRVLSKLVNLHAYRIAST